MKRFLFIVGIGCFLSRGLLGFDCRNSIVKVFTTFNEYNYESPWSPPIQLSGSGSGFIIEGDRIVTNAHVVSEGVFIRVKLDQDATSYPCQVEWIGHDCDLAILKVEDPLFFVGTVPLEISNEMASLQDEVIVCGFPVGGERLSITKGIISRTEETEYVHGRNFLLTTQIDAAINPGNSGGPVISKNKVVGVAHQGFFFAQNIGYMIPAPIIQHFIQEVKQCCYNGFPSSGIKIQTMENQMLRNYYQMKKHHSGVLIIDVKKDSILSNTLLVGDILLTIDGIPIANDGRVALQKGVILPFTYLFSLKFYGETVELKVLRNGKIVSINALINQKQISSSTNSKIKLDNRPPYFIIGGLVFQTSEKDYVNSWFNRNKSSFREGIILSRVLPHEMNIGYQNISDQLVTTVNGKEIETMRDLIQAFETNKESFHHITTMSGLEIILDRLDVEQHGPQLLKNYLISSDRFLDGYDDMPLLS